MSRCRNQLPHGAHGFLADSDAITYSKCPGVEPFDTECPDEEGPFHWWECDGPFTVSCANCNADGRITMTSGPQVEADDEDGDGDG